MTCVAAKIVEDQIHIAADSMVTGWGTWDITAQAKFSKIERVDDHYVLSGSGDREDVSLFFLYAKTHKIPDLVNMRTLVEWLRDYSKWRKDTTGSWTAPGNILVAHPDGLFEIVDYDVAESDSYITLGSGAVEAAAALHLGHSVEEAVGVACDLNCFCNYPILTDCVALNKKD